MKPILAASLIALVLAAPAAAQSGAPGDFRLPPNPTPTRDPDIQGPVDPEAPILTRPRAPTPTPTPRPAVTLPAPTPTPAPVATRSPAPRPTATARAAPTSAPAQALPDDAPTSLATPTPDALPLPTIAAPPPAVATAPAEDEGGFPWGWTLLGALALAAAGAAGFARFRRRQEEWAEPPAIEPPLARRPAPAPQPEPAAAPLAPVVPLMVEAQALTLSRSMMFATLKYELRLANRGQTALTRIRLGGDLVTAHGRVPVDQQLADPAVPLEVVQQVPALGPGESTVLTGELRLPVQQIRPIAQGRAVLYIPLLRLRIEAAELAPFARTFVVGKRPAAPGGKLQPFRLDETPQTYRGIAQRALD